ncbi:hypothetical protein UFOVP276_115 [uncultured Caudovirales phage]|uniref:Uncharacterized protein n=1 Tax=uncultured Caudovirales phage TaxID=2100421 RepID=A0A6J5L870_9CAUD|nr:hypothetical protein UFOVP127_9 [uncultured Caudovirales phage]CAB4135159.1 hypothetical protein UFOVP276_115 [uncultured Caudovirales phage]
MGEYTPAEIEAAVQQFVQSSVVVNKDVLGPIDVSSRFDEVMQLFASTLIFDPNSLFYLIYLASNRLCADVIAAISLLEDVQLAIDEIKRKTTKISQTTLLGDAAASLTVMGTILAQNAAVSTPPYDRYVIAIDKFRDVSLAPNIKSSGVIVRAPQEAKASAVTSLSGLRAVYPELLSRADVLLTMVDQYMALNLPTISLLQSLQKARQDLITLQQALESPTATEDQKISMSRDAYLRITAGKAVVSNLRGVKKPTDLRMESNSKLVGSVALPSPSGTFTPATVQTALTTSGWPIVAGVNDTLIIAEDGNAPTTYTITAPSTPSVTSFESEDAIYAFHDDTPAVVTTAIGPFNIPVIAGAIFYVTVDGVLFQGTLPTGASVSASSVAASIGALISDYTDLNSVATVAVVGGGGVKITHNIAGARSIFVSDSDEYGGHRWLSALGLRPFSIYTGTAANNKLCIDGLSDLVYFDAHPSSIAQIADTVATWASTYSHPYTVESPGGNKITIRKNVAGNQSITMSLPTGADRATVAAAFTLLGFYDGQTDSSSSVSAAELATAINLLGKVTATAVKGTSGEYVKIASKSTALATELIIGAGTANATLGLTAGTYKGNTTGFVASLSGKEQDPADYDVAVGDILYIPKDSGTYRGTVASVTNNILDLNTPLSTGSAITSFAIMSADYAAYLKFVKDMGAWKGGIGPKYEKDTLELDRLMNPLLQAGTPTDAQVADAKAGADSLKTVLDGLKTCLKDYVVRRSTRIDACINMLRERGLDRAYDTLMRGELTNFFSYDKDEAATASYMLKTMRALAQQDLPVSKISETLDDTVLQSSAIVNDVNFDFSDSDNENLKLLGSVPDFDTDTTVPANYFKSTY